MDLNIGKKRALGFRQILDTIKDLPITDTNLTIGVEGLSIESMDPSHVSVIILKLDKSYFSEYKCNETIVLGINLVILGKIFKSITKTESLRLYKEIDEDYLNIKIYNETRSQEFNIPLFDLTLESLGIPEMNYPIIYSLSCEEFSRILSDISLVESRDVTITMGNSKLVLEAKGELGKTKIIVEGDKDNKDINDNNDNNDNNEEENQTEIEKISLTSDNNKVTLLKDGKLISQSFTLDILRNIAKAKQFTKRGTIISYANNSPLSICYPFGKNSHLLFYLAPKIEDTD